MIGSSLFWLAVGFIELLNCEHICRIGHKGLIYGSKAMAMTMADLFENPELVEKVKAEYIERKGDEVYKAIIPEGPPPINGN